MPTIFSKNSQPARHLPEVEPVLDWIDRELKEASCGGWRGADDVLLELRQVFRSAHPGRVIARFFKLLPRLEKRHFLLGYRIRQWIALRFEVSASDPLSRVPEARYSLDPMARTLPRVRNHFFEHATQLISLEDIRVALVPVKSREQAAGI